VIATLVAVIGTDVRARGWAASSARPAPAADDLIEGFTHPPASARPWVYWMWMDGNLTREGITADLEAMKRAGIGGVIAMEVNVGIPRGPVEFMSAEWRRLFAHAVREAERLGLEITLNAGPGWTGSGGPWVKPEQSMRHIVASATLVSGPRRFDDILTRPARRPGFFGDGLLPPDLEKIKNDYYRDVAVLAFPTPPAATGLIADIDEKALYVRAPYSSQPGVRPFLPSPADYPAIPSGSAVELSRVIDLTTRLAADGRLVWDVPAGDWTILRFGSTSTGATTRPAPVPGLGLECDKLDKAALDAQFDAFVGALLKELGGQHAAPGAGWTYLHIDSWEMGAQNWTDTFREEFRRRRGYDLWPYLPTITGRIVGSLEISERFLWDLRQTANELVLANHAGHLKELGRRHGFGLSIEPYDMTPCADLSLGAAADVPMGEFWLYGFNTFHSVIEAVSVAHTCGRPVVGAESFTSLDTEKWQAYPSSMKALGDWALAAGVNRFVFHRYQHQPWLDRRPGMTMGPFGVHWERTQTWWDMAPAYHIYLSRCQFMLRRGLPVADVLYLAAEGAPLVFRAPASATRGDPPDRLGYNFDGCAPDTFLARVSVSDGRLVLPDGMSYRVLVLPERETMTPALLRRVRELAAAGATVIGPRPRKSPSLSGYPGCDAEVRKLADEVWGDCDGTRVTEHRLGRGRVIWERWPAGAALQAGSSGVPEAARVPVQPDKSICDVDSPPLSEPGQYGDFATVERALVRRGVPPDFESEPRLRYAHRKDGAADIYFVANPEDRVMTAECIFRVDGRRPELWDAVTGGIRELSDFSVGGGRTSVLMRFEPHQSFFVVFRTEATAPKEPGTNFADLSKGSEIAGPWEVAFDPKWGGPEKVVFQALEDWTLRPEDGIKYYSGLATYRKTFDLPAAGRLPVPSAEKEGVPKNAGVGKTAAAEAAVRWWLDLGVVRNMARVRLNGSDLGVVWCAPWRVDITGAVKAEGNQLEITVANLWPNRLIGDERLPADCEYGKEGNLLRWPDWLVKGEPRPSCGRLTFSTWKHFTENSPLLPSGLIGPVILRAVRTGGAKIVRIDRPLRYPDGRPAASWRLEARDQGIVYRHGRGPDRCDELGARDVWVWESGGTYYMHYDGAGLRGWLTCLAASSDLRSWSPKGPALRFGEPGTKDSASASYGVTYDDGRKWHLFYLGTPHTSPPPDLVPSFPYLTMKAEAESPAGPWKKRYDIMPFSPKPGTYYSATASPGQVVGHPGGFLMFFSASTDGPIRRSIGIARSRVLDGTWMVDPEPILPPAEQVENTSLYFEESSRTWFLFTNHVGLEQGLEYTDAVWVYWTNDLERWDPSRKAVVLDGASCGWSKKIIGLPSVVRVGDRLALFYDGHEGPSLPPGVKSHMGRDVGFAWLELPIVLPDSADASISPRE
jgi:hypothetical protein